MAEFLVSYREYAPGGGRANHTFRAERVTLTDNNDWFHFVVGEEIVARVRAEDVRVIEAVGGATEV